MNLTDFYIAEAENSAPGDDPVNHPAHYTKGGIECLDAIAASMTDEAYRGYLKGNIMKYLWRYEQKGGVESLEKGMFYLSELIGEVRKADE